MGRTSAHWTVHASLSRHNSEQDVADNEAWIRLTDELRAICDKPEYADLISFHDGDQRCVWW